MHGSSLPRMKNPLPRHVHLDHRVLPPVRPARAPARAAQWWQGQQRARKVVLQLFVLPLNSVLFAMLVGRG